MIRILVTAFGAFPGAPSNPTMAIAAALEKRRRALRLAGIEIVTAVLPVEFDGTEERLRKLIAGAQPDAVLHLGLAGRRKKISVETRALNRLTMLRPGADRKTANSLLAERGGPTQRRSRYGAQVLARVIGAAGAPAACSIDAGDYLCNQALYLSLGMHDLPCGFIHVPRARRKGARRADGAQASQRPTLPQMSAGIEAAARMLAKSVFIRRNHLHFHAGKCPIRT